MRFTTRREFLRAATMVVLSAAVPVDIFAQAAAAPSVSSSAWDSGFVSHLLPTVSDTRMLIKASFKASLEGTPRLRVGDHTVQGRMGDTHGEHWHFYAIDLLPGRRYPLSLISSTGRSLCQPWELATFPSPDERPQKLRVLFYTCAGGHALMREFLPPAVRNRLLRRGLAFQPDAVVANGDHVYWDLLSPRTARISGASPRAEKIAGKFERASVVLGDNNEAVLKRATGPQIVPVYETDFRSTPVFFLQDDHDYFDNDVATDEIITFPPSYFMLQLARATQNMYYPEFLPDVARPRGFHGRRRATVGGVSECFGTIRYGRLAEILLYDTRRTQRSLDLTPCMSTPRRRNGLRRAHPLPRLPTLCMPLRIRQAGARASGASEYPDVTGPDRELMTSRAEPYWQSGWLKQHDRLMQAISAMDMCR